MTLTELTKNPVVVVLVALTYFFLLDAVFDRKGSHARKEIRQAYEEVQAIADELAQTDEPGKVKAVVSHFAEDIVGGFRQAFHSDGDRERLVEFVNTKEKIVLRDVTRAMSSWQNKEKFVGIIENQSEHPIAQIQLNMSCYSEDGKLMDAVNKWLNEIQLLQPGESMSFGIERAVRPQGASEQEADSRAHSIELKVASFKIKKLEPEPEEQAP